VDDFDKAMEKLRSNETPKDADTRLTNLQATVDFLAQQLRLALAELEELRNRSYRKP
jgi:hypothetical protein